MNNTRGYEPWNRSLILLGGTKLEQLMKMTKICIHSCDLPEDDLSRKRFDIDLRLELALCILDGKIIPFNVTRVNHNTVKREWRDQEAVDEFYKFFNELFTKYGGKLHYVEVIDI